MRTSRFLVAGIVAISLLAAACGGKSTDREKPKTVATPAPAAAIDVSKDDLGRSVTLPKTTSRIVAMSPSIVELMYAVGATPVGRPSSADFPDAAKSVPAFGTSYQPSFEEIVNMKPDLIIADAIIDAGPTLDALTKLNVPVFAIRVTSFEDITHALRVVGVLSNNKDAGDAAAKKLEAKLSDVLAKVPATSNPTFLILVSAGPNQFIAEKDGSYLANVMKTLKAKNLVAGEPDNFRFPGFTDYSPERIVEKNPDIVITISEGGPPGTPKTADAVKSNAALSSLKAVKEGRIYEVDAPVYLQSAGPRVSIILDELPRLLYPTAFAAPR